MKKVYRHINPKRILLLILLFTAFHAFAGNGDTVLLNKAQFDSINKKVVHIDSNVKKLADSASAKAKQSDTKCTTCRDTPPKDLDWLLIFLPAIIFLALFIFLFSTGLKDFNLKEAMSESEYPKVIIENSEYTPANLAALKDVANLEEILPPTIEISDRPQVAPGAPPASPPPPHASISRYIAFITSMLSLVVALCISCFFIYSYIRTGCAPDISGISTILIALGMGVLPYAFNKVSTAISKNKTE
jgi:hypothetical protein